MPKCVPQSGRPRASPRNPPGRCRTHRGTCRGGLRRLMSCCVALCRAVSGLSGNNSGHATQHIASIRPAAHPSRGGTAHRAIDQLAVPSNASRRLPRAVADQRAKRALARRRDRVLDRWPPQGFGHRRSRSMSAAAQVQQQQGTVRASLGRGQATGSTSQASPVGASDRAGSQRGVGSLPCCEHDGRVASVVEAAVLGAGETGAHHRARLAEAAPVDAPPALEPTADVDVPRLEPRRQRHAVESAS